MLLPILLLLSARIASDDPAVPFRQPQLAASRGQVAMTFGAGSAIYFAFSADQGTSFSKPVKVDDVRGLALGRHRGPRVAFSGATIVISAVAGEKKGGGADGNLIVWRSVDRGGTWARSGVINDVPESAREGLHAMAADAQGNLFAAWLDLRSKGTKLYGAKSIDGGLTWSKNTLVYASPDGTICQCCDPAIAIDDSGQIAVMWRNVLDGSRDLYVSTSKDGVQFEPARKLGVGTWKLEACPMDGGGVAMDHGQTFSAWRRGADVFLSSPGGPEKRIGSGKDVAIAQSKRGTFVAWGKGAGLEIFTPNAAGPEALTSAGEYVNLLALPDGSVLAAWEAHGSIETKRVK